MDLEKILKRFTILEYISTNSNCRAPEIRDFLGIIHSSNPSKEEKEFYQILNKLDQDGYALKLPIRKVGSGGAHFALILTGKGQKLLTQLKDFSSKELRDKKRFSDVKSKSIVLSSMITVFSGEVFDIILDLIQEVMGEEFDIDFDSLVIDQQNEIIDKINGSLLKVRDRVSQIAQSFF